MTHSNGLTDLQCHGVAIRLARPRNRVPMMEQARIISSSGDLSEEQFETLLTGVFQCWFRDSRNH